MFETDHCFQLLNKSCCEHTSSLHAIIDKNNNSKLIIKVCLLELVALLLYIIPKTRTFV